LDSQPAKGSNLAKAPPRRGVYILPSLFTLGTLICGYIAILSTLNAAQMLAAHMGTAAILAAFDDAAQKIGWAIVFDGLDGRIARLTNSSSDFGREFDSLADVIAFGVAPAFLAYTWGVRAVQQFGGAHVVFYLQKAGWVVAFAFVLCGAARLARFNIDKGATTDRRYFVGLPIPAAAGVIAAIVHWEKYPVNDWIYGIGWLVVVGVTAFLMVSRVRYFSFKKLDLRRPRPFFYVIIGGIILWAFWIYSEPVLLVIASVYALSGPLARLASKLRPRSPAPASEGSTGQEAHPA
jgi:CDP-diacylglycerol---serine O-phosphatidyltransferase